jgi:type II secretion system protein D
MRPLRLLLLAATSGLALCPSTLFAQQRPTTQPSGNVVGASGAAPVASPQPVVAAAEPRDIRFQFDGIPYADVVRRFSQMLGKPLVGELNIEGTLTFFDSQPYTYSEAVDTLNTILGMRGFTLVETDRFLQLVPLKDIAAAPLRILKGTDPTGDVRPGQIVTIVLPLKFLDADAAAKAVQPMVSTFGKISTLSRGRGIVITDRMASIDRVRTLLSEIDANALVDRQLRTYVLKKASARDAARMINDVFKSANVAATRRPEEGGQPGARLQWSVSATADERTNTLVLMGATEQITMAEDLLAKLEGNDPDAPTSDVRTFELKEARAEVMLATLRQAMLPSATATAKEKELAAGVKIIADPISNRIIASAPEAQMRSIAKLVQELDKASKTAQVARVFRMKSADAQQLAAVVTNTFGRLDANNRVVSRIAANADAKSNTLIVAGAPEDMEQVDKLVAELDREQAQGARDIHIVQLQTGDARQIATSLVRLFQQRAAATQGQSPKLTIEAEPATNSLLIAAAPQDWPDVQAALEQLKAAVAPGMTPVTRIVKLKHVRPNEMADTLRQIFANRPRSTRPNQQGVSITASERADSLIVSAPEDDQKSIAELVKSLDVAPDDKSSPVRLVKVQSADAVALAQTLRAMLPQPKPGQRASDISVQADPGSNTVLIRAPEDEQSVMAKMVESLDQSMQLLARQTRLVQLQSASASYLASVLNQMYRGTPPTPAQRRAGINDPLDRVVASAAPGDRTLILDGPAQKIEEVAQLAKSLDQDNASPMTLSIRTYQLTNTKAPELADRLSRLFAQQPKPQRPGVVQNEPEPQPKFEADASTNQIIVAATERQFTAIEALLKELQAAQTLASQTKSFTLKFARAQDVANVLGPMLIDTAAPQRRGAAAVADVRVGALVATNMLVVQAPPEKMAMAEQLLATFDVPEADTQVTLQSVQLKNAQAQTLAEAMASSLSERNNRQQAGSKSPTTVTAEPNSNTLLVRGPATDVAAVVQMIRDLDKGSVSSEVAVRVFRVENSKASDLATSVGKLFADIIRQQSGNRRNATTPPFAVASDERTNSLVISTTTSNFALIEQLLRDLDKAPERAATEAQIVRLTDAKAEDVAFTLRQMYSDRKGPAKPVIESDDIANTLTLIARDEDLRVMQPIIAKLDGAAKDQTLHVRVIPLSQTRAEAMAATLREIYPQVTGRPVIFSTPAAAPVPGATPTVSPAPATQPSPRATPQTAPDRSSLVPPARTPGGAENESPAVDSNPQPLAVGIAVDKTANALIVSGTRQALDDMESLISRLSVGAAGRNEAEFRVFKVQRADPESVARTLDDLYNPKLPPQLVQQQQQQRRGQNQPQQQGNPNQQQQQVQLPPPVIGVVADPRTRSVIVRAKPTDFDVLAGLIEHLDQASTVSGEVRVFSLKNTDAAEVASNLKDLLRLSLSPDQSAPANAPAAAAGNDVEANAQPQAQRAITLRQALRSVRGTRGQTSEEGPATSVSANRQTNSVVVAAPSEVMPVIAGIVQELDQSAAISKVPAVRFYPLAHADVRGTAATLQQLFADASQQPGQAQRGGQQPPAIAKVPVVIAADEAARLVIVSAPTDQHELVAQVIKQIDEAQRGETTVQVYRLDNVEATTVAGALNAAMESDSARAGAQGRRGSSNVASGATLRIAADASSNALVVRADEQQHTRITALISEMDRPASLPAVQVIPLATADPAGVAQILSKVFSSGNAAAARSGRPGAPQRGSVVIEADRDARLLMVRADDATFEKIRTLAAQLDAASPAGQSQRTLVQLKFAQAPSVAAAITQAFAPTRGQNVAADQIVTAVPEPMSNSVIIAANPANMQKVQTLIASLDTEAVAGGRVEAVTLKTAKATELAVTLGRVSGAGARGPGQSPVTIAPDAGSNTLILTGPPADVSRLVQMARQLDQSTTPVATNAFILPLKNGDAASVALMVRDLYQQQALAALRAGRTIDPLAVTADDRANALVLASSEAMRNQVADWVQKVEDMKPARGPLKIIQFQNADPAEVDKAIRDLFNQRSPGANPGPGNNAPNNNRRRDGGQRSPNQGGPGSDTIQTTTLPQQKSILISASDEDFQVIEQLVQALDAAAGDAKPAIRVFELKHASNLRVVAALSTMFRPAQGQRAANPDDTVTITALPQSSAVVVAAGKRRMEEVEKIITQLDRVEIAAELEFKVFKLENASPTKVLPLLTQMLAQVQRDRPGETISAQADERSRSIIVTARGTLFEQVEKIVKTLDQPAALSEAQVAVLPLKKSDAARLSTVINDMLKPGSGGQPTPEALALQEQVRRLRVRGTDQFEMPTLDLTKPIKVTADTAQGSNALVVTSTADNIKAIESIVEMLDVAPLAEGVKVRLLHLDNADATSVTNVLREIFTQGQRLAGKPGSPAAGKAEPDSVSGRGLVSPLNVSLDVRTNTLVLSGVEESLALAEAIVKDLDKNVGKIVTDVKLFRLKHADAVKMLPVLQAVFAEQATPPGAVPGAEGLATQVTRLRTVIDKDSPTTKIAKSRAAVTVQADASTNTLVVAARSDVMPLIADVVEHMDIPGAGSLSLVRIYPMLNADATRAKQMIDALHAGPAAKLIRDEDKPTVVADTRTNALVISGSEKTLALVETLLPRIDAKTPVALADVRLIELKNAEAATLAPTMQKMMDARVQRQTSLGAKDSDAYRVTIAADARSNSLIVGGSQEGFDLVKLLSQQLDAAKEAFSGTVQLFPLEHANAGSVATTLTNLFNQRYQAARSPDLAKQKPVIVPDLRTNSLMIAANADDTKALTALLKTLDVQLSSPSVLLEVVALKNNDAGVVAPMIRTIFASRQQSMTLPGQQPQPQDKVDVSFDPLTNALVISASKENLSLIKGLLEKVDVPPASETGIVRLYPLRNADAQRVATMLQSLVSQGLYKPGVTASGGNTGAQQREKVAVATDLRTNVLIVSASKENFAVIEEILKGVDNTQDFTLSGDIRLFTLVRADATRLSPVLQNFFNAKRAAEIAAAGGAQGSGGGRSLPVTIIPDSRTNTLLVAGSRESFAAVENMIKRLDGDNALALSDFRVFYLKHGSATNLQPTIQQLFDQRAARDEAKRAHQVTIVADGRTNALIVGGDPEDMEVADGLVKRLDVAPDQQGSTLQVFPLVKADALQVAATLRSLYASSLAPAAVPKPGSGPAIVPLGPAGEPLLSISADTRLNAIIVSAGQTDLTQIAELVRQLDGETATQVAEIRVFPLKFADAGELAQVLSAAIAARSKAAGAGAAAIGGKQQVLQFVTKPAAGGVLSTLLDSQDIVITPDKRTNAVVVSASVDSMPLVESLIRAMDSVNTQEAQIRVFRLTNADARQMADVLTQLFGLKSGGASARAITYTLMAPPAGAGATTRPAEGEAGPVTSATPNAAATPAVNASATLGSAEQYALTVTVDIRTNSLLVGGTSRYVGLVESIIKDLDASPAQERMTEVYRLRNAQATDIETALKSFLNQERERVVAAMGRDRLGAAERLLEREVAVVAEKVSNTLLLSASPRYFQTIADMIRELDQPPPQVLIQCLLAEVTLDNTTDLGFEWAYSFNVGGSTATIGDNFGNLVDRSRTPVPKPGASNLFPGGFSAAVTGGDLSMVFRALQNQGRLEILSRPQVLASDNQAADLNVGQEVPLIDTSRISENGTTLSTVKYRRVGVTLTVLPRINPDGSVKLQVNPEVSSLSSSTVQVSSGVNSPIINTRSATTTVNVQDGHTIVIGGLITTKDDDRERKVPLLGDIPILEYLFKSRSHNTERTELLIVLTPRVLRSPAAADQITSKQIKQLNTLRKIKPEQMNAEMYQTLNQGVPVGMTGQTPKDPKAEIAPETSAGSDPIRTPSIPATDSAGTQPGVPVETRP